jgi:hypothetical protein
MDQLTSIAIPLSPFLSLWLLAFHEEDDGNAVCIAPGI